MDGLERHHSPSHTPMMGSGGGGKDKNDTGDRDGSNRCKHEAFTF